jgi:pyruvate/2-oxoglutarate dehydrogenase complex dihydrolipoamide acyltransferase (E2) component
MSVEIRPFPREREIVVDAGYLGAGRHIIYALLEVDITRARHLIDLASRQHAQSISFTAFIVASLAQAISADPSVQAYRDWRGRLFIYKDVDVVTMIEAKRDAVAIPHIIRRANEKTFLEISDEIRAIQRSPASSEQQGRLYKLGLRAPRFIRMAFFRIVKLRPIWFKQFEGTTVITSVGMFGRGGGWGIGFMPTHTLGITIGGISQKPGIYQGQITPREYLNLTLSFDHDIVDGAPAARFSRSFVDSLEAASVLRAI